MTSVIHDIGYQRYQGPRLGRGYAARSLFTHSLRTSYGLGRTAKAKVFPWLVAGLVGSIAVVVTAIYAVAGERVISYGGFPESTSLLLVLFVAVVAPELVSRDLRTGVLHLYFSRPLRREDYAVAKLAALTAATWLLIAVPLLVMLLGALFSVDGWGAVWSELGGFGGGLAYAALTAVVYGSIAVAIASLLGRRAVAAGAIVAVFLLTTPIVGLLEVAGGESAQQLAGLFSPMTLLMGVRGWFDSGAEAPYPGPYGWVYGAVTLGLVAAAVGLLLVRYRRVQR
jgi:ABC-2 type transport system permease protein